MLSSTFNKITLAFSTAEQAGIFTTFAHPAKTESLLSVTRLRKGRLLVSGRDGGIWVTVSSTLYLIELLFLFMQSKNVKV